MTTEDFSPAPSCAPLTRAPVLEVATRILQLHRVARVGRAILRAYDRDEVWLADPAHPRIEELRAALRDLDDERERQPGED